ncbi:hypothetical protein [Mucilaginibacter sp.]
MYTLKISLCACLLLLAFKNQETEKIPAGSIKGDFNGDGIKEYAWIVKPQLSADGMSCVGPCVAHIVFSDKKINPILLKNSIGGTLTNLGDLKNNGKDDIGLLPDWFTSCWRSYFTYTLNNNNWQYVIPPFTTHCNQWEANVKPVEKIAGKPNYLKENYSDFLKDSIVVKSKIVKIID